MSIPQQLYYWMKERSESHIIRAENISVWAEKNGITPQEKGYALQLLKNEGYIVWRGTKHGWLVIK